MARADVPPTSDATPVVPAAPDPPAPPAPAPPSAASPPPAAAPPLAAPPSPAPVPPAPSPPEAIAAAPQASGFAIELGTGGLSGGSVGLGWGWARSALGLAVDYRRSDFGGDPIRFTAETIESRLSLGPWARVELARALDGRVGLLAAIDLQYSWLSNEIKPTGLNAQPNDLSASGIVLRAGPGIRWWATPWLAVGYTAQLSFSKLTVKNSAPSTPIAGATSSSVTETEIALTGRFLVLAVF